MRVPLAMFTSRDHLYIRGARKEGYNLIKNKKKQKRKRKNERAKELHVRARETTIYCRFIFIRNRFRLKRSG